MSDNYGAQRWVSFLNDSGETIPSYALVNFVSDAGAADTVANYAQRLKGKKFASSDDQGVYALNSRTEVPSGEYGKCTFAIDAPAWARLKDTDLTGVDLDEDAAWIEREYGPQDGKWSIGPDGAAGYRILTRPRKLTGTDYHRALVIARSAKYPLLVKNGTSDKIGGQADGNGLSSEVLCYIVTDTLIGTHSTDPEDRIAVNFDSFNAVIFPHESPDTHESVEPLYCCWAVPASGGKWKAISGGVVYFEGTVETVVDDIISVTPEFGGNDVPNVTAEAFCDDNIVDGVLVGIQVYNKTLRIVNVCCMTGGAP